MKYILLLLFITSSILSFGQDALNLFIFDVEHPEHKKTWTLMRKPIH